VPETLLQFLNVDAPAVGKFISTIRQQVADLAQAYGLPAQEPAVAGTPERRPPQRCGHYICRTGAGLDSLAYFLDAEGAECQAGSDLKAWKAEADETWCWVNVTTPAFAKEVLAELQAVSGDAEQARRNLLLLLPAGVQDPLRRLLSEAKIAFLVEPWCISTLRETLGRMRSIAGGEPEVEAAVGGETGAQSF